MASEQVNRIRESADWVRARTKVSPQVGIILGTGLGDFAGALDLDVAIPYEDIQAHDGGRGLNAAIRRGAGGQNQQDQYN